MAQPARGLDRGPLGRLRSNGVPNEQTALTQLASWYRRLPSSSLLEWYSYLAHDCLREASTP